MAKGVVALLLVVSLSAAQELSPMPEPISARKPNLGIYAAEAGGGLALATIGLSTSVLLALSYGGLDDERIAGTFAILFVATPVLGLTGLAGGTCIAGDAYGQQGRFLPTLAYSAGAAAIGAGLCWGGARLADGRLGRTAFVVGRGVTTLGIVTIAAMPLAAVYGYNRSRPPEIVGGRFEPGSIALGAAMDTDGVTHPSLDVRLVNVRF